METGAMGVMHQIRQRAAAYSYLIFVLLYIPCISVMGGYRSRIQPWLDVILHPVGTEHRLLARRCTTRP